MTVTNTSENGNGIYMMNAKVELFDVLLEKCGNTGLHVQSSLISSILVATRCEFSINKFGAEVNGGLTSATFKNCVFNDNSSDGISGWFQSTIHLYGEATAIHSNGQDGIYASRTGKIVIHLPSHHNTSYNNGEDRRTIEGGTITNVED